MSNDHPYNAPLVAAEQAIEDAKKHRDDVFRKLYPPRMQVSVTFPSGVVRDAEVMQTGAGMIRVIVQDGEFLGREGLFSIRAITPRGEPNAS